MIYSGCIQHGLEKLPTGVYLLASRLFTTAYFLFYMVLWRSFWNLLYLVLPTVTNKLVAFLVSALMLCGLGSFNSNIGVPGSVGLDNTEDYCIVSIFNGLDPKNHVFKVVNIIISIIIEVLVIVCWFGTYEVLVYTLPSQPEVSKLLECLLPIVFGIISGALAFLVQLCFIISIEKRKNSSNIPRRLAQVIISSIGISIMKSVHT